MHYTLFPKFFQGIPDAELMEICNRCQLDSPMALIRDGFALSPENLKTTIPAFVAAAQKAGMRVETACVDWVGEDLLKNLDSLKCLADNGITTARAGLCFRDIPIPQLAERARKQAIATAEAAEKSGVRLLIQLHHFAYPHCATAVKTMIDGLDPAHIGVWLDSGNNTYEGDEAPVYQNDLLGDYVGAFGAKDAAWFRDGDGSAPDKGWLARFVPLYAGRTNWHQFIQALHSRDIYAVLMPFYQMEKTAFIQTLAREVEYLRRAEKASLR